MKSVFLIEDHPIVRDSLASYLEETGRWRVTGSASSLEQAKEYLTKNTADIILLDIQLNDELGLNIIPWLKQQHENDSQLPIFAVFTSYNDFVYASAALVKGVSVYMCKHHSVSDLEKALCDALEGKTYIDSCVQSKLDNAANILSLLTKREKEIFAMVKSGFSNKEIAKHLNISYRTVENILCCVYDKVGVKSRHELQNI